MPVGELFLSAFLQVLFDRLASRELLQFARREGIHSKLMKWKKELEMIEAVLVDAGEKQLTDRAVKLWLDGLQDLAYDAEDVLDEFATEVSSRNLMAERHRSTIKVLNLVRSSFSNCSPSAVMFNCRMRSKINGISSRLEELCKRKMNFGLQLQSGRLSQSAVPQRPPSTSLSTEPFVYGRNKNKAEILEMVLRNEPRGHVNLHVISIVGMEGVGKTTLAREVFNDAAVESFEVKAWVCVSDDFGVTRISKSILEYITRTPCQLKELSTVQIELHQKVAGRKLLLVLDDVWSDDYGKWKLLESAFRSSASGSRIIVTTRLRDVALTISPGGIYPLELLPYEDCWHVFAMHAFENEGIPTHSNIEFIRQKVVEKSKGLPLAAKALGGLLRLKQKEDEWVEILNSKIWDLWEKDGDEILQL